MESEVLPSRTEVVVRFDPDAELAEGVLHPGVVSLMEHVAAMGHAGGLERIRQVGVLGDDGSPTTMELVYDLT